MCLNLFYVEEAYKSKNKFLEFLLCTPKNYTELLRHKQNLLTKEKLNSLQFDNLANDNKKLKIKMKGKNLLGEVESRKIKKENTKPVVSSYGFIQQEYLNRLYTGLKTVIEKIAWK